MFNYRKYKSFLDIPISKLDILIEDIGFQKVGTAIVHRDASNKLTYIDYMGENSYIFITQFEIIEVADGEYVKHVCF